MKYDVVTVGQQCVDIVSSPVRSDALRRDLTLVSHTTMYLGGDALNQALTLSRYGLKVALMGLTGRDRMGDILISQLSACPNLTVLNKRGDVNTSISIVLIDEMGERHFIFQPESNLSSGYQHIDEDAVRSAACLTIGGCLSLPGLEWDGLIRLLTLAKASGAKTVMDFSVSEENWDEGKLCQALRLVDYALPSELEARLITGVQDDPVRMARALTGMGAANCLIKLGDRGCYVSTDDYSGFVAACPSNVVDTTGAGDAFSASFVYGLTRGWDMLKCAQFANAAGSVAVESIGANTAIQRVDQVLNRMRIYDGRRNHDNAIRKGTA